MRKATGFVLIFIGLLVLVFVGYKNSRFSQVPQTFSSYSILTSSWEKYKNQFINNDGRVIDPSQSDITTSEGQSYAMLRAVWVDDKPTFDKVWNWTKTNLKRPNDNLFGWRWGQRSDGSYGFLPGGGNNSAADADEDIALALIFASKRWNDPSYENVAKPVLNDIWNIETAQAGGQRYLIAGNWAQDQTKIIVDPSYFAPYEWRIFAKVDPSHDWNILIDPAYTFLNTVGTLPLNTGKGVGLPPDWAAINKSNGQISPTGMSQLDTNYGFDAMRVPFRIALDYLWFHEFRAKAYLDSSFAILGNTYTSAGQLAGSYSHDGKPILNTQSPSMYATSLGYFIVSNPSLAQKIYQDKLIKLYSGTTDSFNSNLPYYDQNWLWFGAALYNNFLQNLGP